MCRHLLIVVFFILNCTSSDKLELIHCDVVREVSGATLALLLYVNFRFPIKVVETKITVFCVLKKSPNSA